MSDLGAFSGTWALSEQLRMYRWADTLDRARYNNELAIDNALLRRDVEEIVARYNELVGQINQLLRNATAVATEAEHNNSIIAELQRQVEELRRKNAALDAESERLRSEKARQAAYIEILTDFIRRHLPGSLPDC